MPARALPQSPHLGADCLSAMSQNFATHSKLLDVVDNKLATGGLHNPPAVGGGVVRRALAEGNTLGHFCTLAHAPTILRRVDAPKRPIRPSPMPHFHVDPSFLAHSLLPARASSTA